MNKNIKNENIALTSVAARCFAETAVEGETLVPDYYPNIMRMIRTEAEPFIRTKTVRAGRISVEGSVAFRVVYISEDNALRSFCVGMPFSQSIEMKCENPEACSVSAKIAYANARALSPQKIYLKATVSLSADAFSSTETQVVVPDAENRDIYMKTRSLHGFSVAATSEKPVRVSDEISLGGKSAAQIIRYDAAVSETERKLVGGKLVIKGEMSVKALYSEAETNELCSVSHRIAFSQVLEVAGADEECEADISFFISEISVTFGENSVETAKSIIVDSEVFVSAVMLKNTETVVCCDAFSSEKELENTPCDLQTGSICAVRKDFTVKESVEIGLYEKIYDISVSATPEDTEYHPESGFVTVNGSMLCSALYLDAEGDISSAENRLPFSVQLAVPFKGSAAVTRCSVAVIASAFVGADSRHAELRIEAAVTGAVAVIDECECLRDINVSETDITPRTAGITVYYADEGESVFAIAKRYSSDPDAVKKLNNVGDTVGKQMILIR